MKIDLKKEESHNTQDAFLKMFNIQTAPNNNKEDNSAIKLPIENLVPFPTQSTFRRYDDEQLQELSENIRKCGVLSPIIVRHLENGKYQILAGHNRTAAAKLAGLTEIPAIIKNVDDDTANVIFVATNLNQRQKLLPSEKAFAYKMLMNSKQYHNDTVGIGENTSRAQIFRYIRLTNLIKQLLSMVDSGNLIFMVGVNLSYLSQENQKILFNYISTHKVKISLTQAEQLRKADEEIEFSEADLTNLLTKVKPPKKAIKLPLKEISGYFNGLSEKEISTKIIELVKNHAEELK